MHVWKYGKRMHPVLAMHTYIFLFQLTGDQLVLMLEEMLAWSVASVPIGSILASLNRCYSLSQHNAEVSK